MALSVEESGKIYREALDASSDQRDQIREDIAFSDPSDPQQWDDDEKRIRTSDPGGARPCLVFDQTGQYVQNVSGQIEQRPPGLHAIPVGGGADVRVAEQLDGYYRHIEYTSRAQQHYARALTSASRAGVGYLVVRPSYVNRALNWQEPRISSEGDPLRVVFDPWSVELDGSDANFGFLLTPYSHREFERQYGAKEPKISFGDDAQRYVNDDRESILVGEQWWSEDKVTSMLVCLDPQGGEMTLSEDDFWTAHKNGQAFQVIGRYTEKKRCIYWRKLSGAAELSKTTIYPASSIGIVPVYGYVGFKDGRMSYCGIPRRARSAQQAYNYHMSEMRVLMGQAAKAPYLIPLRAFGGDDNIKKLWDRASVESRAFLTYSDMDESGPVAQPQRMQPAINLQNHIAGSMQAREDIQASIGMYSANIGRQSNVTSGVAYDAQRQQGEASTAVFPSHLDASLGGVGKIIMEMVPRLIDTKRQLRILGTDMTPSTVTFDPKQKQPVAETDQGLSINPNIGSYDVRVVSGASFTTQRQETNQALTEMIRANPSMLPIVGPLWAKSLDFPDADKLAQVMTAMAPPQVQAVLNPGSDKQPKLADVMAQNEQLKKALQEATQIAHEAQADADEAHAKLEANEEENAIKAYKAETERLVGLKDAISPAEVQALVVQTIEQMMSHPDPLPGEDDAQTERAEVESMAPGQPQPLGDSAPNPDESQTMPEPGEGAIL